MIAQRKQYDEMLSRMPAETPELLINLYTSLLPSYINMYKHFTFIRHLQQLKQALLSTLLCYCLY